MQRVSCALGRSRSTSGMKNSLPTNACQNGLQNLARSVDRGMSRTRASAVMGMAGRGSGPPQFCNTFWQSPSESSSSARGRCMASATVRAASPSKQPSRMKPCTGVRLSAAATSYGCASGGVGPDMPALAKNASLQARLAADPRIPRGRPRVSRGG